MAVNVASGAPDPKKPSMADLQAELAKLRAENEALRKPQGTLTLMPGPSGALCVYGLGRFPVVLFPDQWDRIYSPELSKAIQDFLAQEKALWDAGKFDQMVKGKPGTDKDGKVIAPANHLVFEKPAKGGVVVKK